MIAPPTTPSTAPFAAPSTAPPATSVPLPPRRRVDETVRGGSSAVSGSKPDCCVASAWHSARSAAAFCAGVGGGAGGGGFSQPASRSAAISALVRCMGNLPRARRLALVGHLEVALIARVPPALALHHRVLRAAALVAVRAPHRALGARREEGLHALARRRRELEVEVGVDLRDRAHR